MWTITTCEIPIFGKMTQLAITEVWAASSFGKTYPTEHRQDLYFVFRCVLGSHDRTDLSLTHKPRLCWVAYVFEFPVAPWPSPVTVLSLDCRVLTASCGVPCILECGGGGHAVLHFFFSLHGSGCQGRISK